MFLAEAPLLVKPQGKQSHTLGAIPTFDLADMPLCDPARVVVLLRWPLIDVH